MSQNPIVRLSMLLCAGAAVLSSRVDAQVIPATTRPSGPEIESSATAVVKLWKVDPPATQPGSHETIQERTNAFGESDRAVRGVIVPTLTIFVPEQPDSKRPAIVICPGGGYGNQVIDREGFFIAHALNQIGVTACVLKYRLPYGRPPAEGTQPPPVQDVQRAIRLLRSMSSEFGIDPNHIGIMGFSAGGHLAGTAATQFDSGDPGAEDPVARQSCRPDFAALIYPVASMRDAIVHKGSRKALIGENADESLQHRYSTDEQITTHTPRLFVVHARDDKVVNVKNSEQIAAAADENGVPCELVLYSTGGHGFGLGLHAGEAKAWFERFADWLSESGHLGSPAKAARGPDAVGE